MAARHVIADALSERHESLTGEASPLDYDGARMVLAALEKHGYAITKTDDGAAVAAQSMGGSLPPAVPSSLTEDGAVTPPADPHAKPAETGGDPAVESATGAVNTAAASFSPTGPGPAATIGGQPGPVVPRRFQLYRHTDVSHVSGVGVVAWGVQWPDGSVSIRWHGAHPSTVAWDSVDDAIAIHGHSGATEARWLDDEPINLWPAGGGNRG